jgi:SAM-dependent methyltransferase
MSSVDQSVAEKAPAKAKAPFRRRFMAWWEGYDLVAREAALEQGVEAEPEKPKLRYEASDERWTTSRIELVQQVWGEGFAGPGGEEGILDLVKPLGLTAAMNVLEVGAGLGGATRIMVDRFGAWVTGFESDGKLAEAGMELSTKAGIAKKAPIQSFDPEHFEAKPKAYDCLVSKEFLFTVEDKERLFRVFNTILKDNGQLLFTDYVLPAPDQRSKALESWVERDPDHPKLWAMQNYIEELTKQKLDIRIQEDITEESRKVITQAWAEYMASVDHSKLDNAMVSAMVDEAEVWARRVKLLESGDLKVCRFHALKKTSDRLLSDW